MYKCEEAKQELDIDVYTFTVDLQYTRVHNSVRVFSGFNTKYFRVLLCSGLPFTRQPFGLKQK